MSKKKETKKSAKKAAVKKSPVKKAAKTPEPQIKDLTPRMVNEEMLTKLFPKRYAKIITVSPGQLSANPDLKEWEGQVVCLTGPWSRYHGVHFSNVLGLTYSLHNGGVVCEATEAEFKAAVAKVNGNTEVIEENEEEEEKEDIKLPATEKALNWYDSVKPGDKIKCKIHNNGWNPGDLVEVFSNEADGVFIMKHTARGTVEVSENWFEPAN